MRGGRSWQSPMGLYFTLFMRGRTEEVMGLTTGSKETQEISYTWRVIEALREEKKYEGDLLSPRKRRRSNLK